MSDTVPFITVVIVTYNHEPFIERCLQSVLYQTYQDFELLYLDNNSKDNTFARAEALLKKSGISYKAEQSPDNLGAARGNNYMLKRYASQSKYVTLLSGDDWLDMENFQYKADFVKANPQYGMVYGNGYGYNNETEEINLFYKQPSPSGWILKELLKGQNMNPEGIFYRHDLFKELNYFDEHKDAKVEDKELWNRIARQTEIGYLHKPLTFYRVNHSGNVSRNLAHMRAGNEYLFKKYEQEFPKEIRAARLQLDQFCAYSLASQKPGWESLVYMLKHYHFNWPYNKQIGKCLLNMMRVKKPAVQ